MFKLFGAIGKFFRAILYTLAGDLSKWTEVWESSTGYIHAEYDDIEKESKKDIKEYEEAIAGIMDLQQTKENKYENLESEIEDLESKLAGAKAKAKSQIQKLQSQGVVDSELLQNDSEVLRCLEWAEKFQNELNEKREDFITLEAELAEYEKQMAHYERKLKEMHSEHKKLREERHETIADMKITKQEQKVSDMLNGISQSKTGERRQRIQELRRKNKNKAKISSKIAGISQSDVENEFADFAVSSKTKDDFFSDLGIGNSDSIVSEPEPVKDEQLPE